MAETTNTAEIQVVVDASGVEAGLRQATGAAERAERTITSGASNSARSQGSLISAIQRTTAQMESGGRAGSRYFEILAQQRGVNPQALEPYLRQLRAVEQAQQRAGQSAAQTSNAMRQLPAQMTDVLTSLQGGSSPLTVLMQQGGQITDSFGGVGAAIRSVGSYVVGLISPLALGAAAVVGLGYAYYAGSQEARAFNLAIATTGNAAGTSAILLAQAAAETSKLIGSQSEAAEVLTAMVATGQISGAAMVELSVAALTAQRDLGREVAATNSEYEKLGKDPVKALIDLAGQYGHVTSATIAQVKALRDEGRAIEAATLAQKLHAEGILSQASKVVENLGAIEGGWRGITMWVKEAAGGAKDWFLSIGRQQTLNGLLAEQAKLESNVTMARSRGDAWGERKQQALLDAKKAEVKAERDKLQVAQQSADAEARRNQAEKLRNEILLGADKLMSRAELKERALIAARTEAAKAGLNDAETKKLVAVRMKEYADVDEAAQKKREAAAKAAAEALKKEAGLLAELAGLTPGFAEDWNRLSKAYTKGALSLDQLTKAQADLLAKQPGIKKANDDQVKAQAESDKLYEQGVKTAEQYRDSLLEQLGAQRESNAVIGLSAEALADRAANALLDASAEKERSAASIEALEPGAKLAQTYREQAAALRELASEKREGARKQIAVDSAKKAQDEWKRASDSIQQSLTDALLRGFESGKSFGKNLVDTLKNMFSTLVLRPVIQAVVSPLAGGIAGSLGLSGAANAATGAVGQVGSLAGSLSGVSNLYSMVSGGATLAGGVGTGFLGSVAGGLNGAGIGSGLTSALGMNIGNSIASVVGPNVASGIATGLSGLAAAAPWVAGALAVYSIGKKAFGRGPKEYTGEQTLNGSLGAGGFSGTLDAEWIKKGGWFRSDKKDVDRNQVGADFSAGLTSAYDAIKATSADFARVLGINADNIANRTQAISIAMGKDEAANQKAIADFFVGVGNTIAGELLPSLSKFQQDGEQASATLQRLATGYALVDTALTSIGMSFGAVGTSSLDARERLLAAAGGLDAFAANTAGFQQNFLSEAERNAPVLKAVTEQLAALGLAGVDTRDEFKQVVLGLDLTTEAGAKQYGELLKMQAAFAQVYPVLEKTVDAAEEAAAKLAEVNKPYLEQIRDLERSLMSATDRRLAEIAGMDASTVALYDHVASLRLEIETRDKAASRAQEVAAEAKSLQDRLDAMTMSTQQLRDKELDQLDASNQAILRNIFAIEDSKTALVAETEVRNNAVQAARDRGADALSGLDSMFSVLQSVVNREKALLQESATAHRSLSSALHGTLDGMRAVGDDQADRMGAQTQIRAALAIARAGGALPDADSLKGALSAVSKDASSMFATQQDYLRDFYATQNDIADLAGLTDKSLSAEEQQLQRLDSILSSAQQQIDALKGVDTSILSLAEAISGFDRALGAAQADPVASSGGSLAKLYKELLGRAPDATGLEFYKDRMAEGVTLDAIRKAIMESVEYKQLRGFAVGTNYVPTNMPAMIHEGERIIPAADNRELMRRLASPNEGNAALVAEVRALREEMATLRGAALRTATATEQTAGSTEQLADQFDNATDGGNAMRADVVTVVKTKEVA